MRGTKDQPYFRVWPK